MADCPYCGGVLRENTVSYLEKCMIQGVRVVVPVYTLQCRVCGSLMRPDDDGHAIAKAVNVVYDRVMVTRGRKVENDD